MIVAEVVDLQGFVLKFNWVSNAIHWEKVGD